MSRVVVLLILSLVLFLFVNDAGAYIYALPYYIHQQYSYPEKFVGQGKVIGYINRCHGKSAAVCDNRIYSKALGQYRSLYVYLPPGYSMNSEPYPVIIALHGFGSDHRAAANILPPLVEEAILNGEMPPVVIISPDFSIGGTGIDDATTLFDETTGSFYINSNVGSFEDYFVDDLVPWIGKEFNVSLEPDKVVLFGQSMGGFGAFSIGLRHPNISTVLVGIYPSVDTRYSCNGDVLQDFDPGCYVPLTEEIPSRKMMKMLGGLVDQSEEELLYTVFNSDNIPGSVWKENLPLWERVREYNPTDILRDERYGDISRTRIYLVAGDEDAYNNDAKVLSFIKEATKHGLTVNPIQPIKEGGHHTTNFVVAQIPTILLWLNDLWNK